MGLSSLLERLSRKDTLCRMGHSVRMLEASTAWFQDHELPEEAGNDLPGTG
jgi:hypothetical protein